MTMLRKIRQPLLIAVLATATFNFCYLNAMKRKGGHLDEPPAKRQHIITLDNDFNPLPGQLILPSIVPAITFLTCNHFANYFPKELLQHIFADLVLSCMVDKVEKNSDDSARLYITMCMLRNICNSGLAADTLKMGLVKAKKSLSDIKGDKYNNVLHWADFKNDIQSMKIVFLATAPKSLNLIFVENADGAMVYPLHLVAEKGTPDDIAQIIKFTDTSDQAWRLLSMMGKRKGQDRSNINQFTALHNAADYGYGDMVKALIQAADNLERTEEYLVIPNNTGFIPLHCAVLKNRIEIVKILLEQAHKFGQAWKSITTANAYGHTPLSWATTRNFTEILEIMESYRPKKELF